MVTAREVKDRVFKALNDHDFDALLECFAPDAVYVNPVGVTEGREQIVWYFDHLLKAFPDLHLTPWQLIAGDSEPAVVEYTMTGTHLGPLLLPGGSVLEATGRRITIRAAGIASIENGQIITDRDYYDQLELYSQLGLCLPETVA